MICLIHRDLTDESVTHYLPSLFPCIMMLAEYVMISHHGCSLCYVIYIDYPDINTTYHPISCNTFVLEWLTVN